MKLAKIAVLVSGGGTNLQALIDAEKKGIINAGRIELVISNKEGAYALERAKNAEIPTAVCEKKVMGENFENEILCTLKKHEIDLIVLAGFMTILSAEFVRNYPNRIINIHPSLIPSFCGMGFYGLKVHEAALDYGVKVTGATAHFVNEIPDGGKIIAQKAVYIEEGDTPETLQRRVMENAEWVILPEAVQKVCLEILKNKDGSDEHI